MTNKNYKSLTSILTAIVFAAATALIVPAQYPPGVKRILAGGAEQTLTGVIRIPKNFGIVPNGPGLNEAAPLPCNPFWVAVLDPNHQDKFIAVTDGLLEPGRDDGIFYTCKYSLTVPANKSLYAVAGMSGPSLYLKKRSPYPMYITDAWVGGKNNKPPRGYERGFAGKFVTLGTVKATYLKFDMYYAQVDPN
jgi:hypothetical protein